YVATSSISSLGMVIVPRTKYVRHVGSNLVMTTLWQTAIWKREKRFTTDGENRGSSKACAGSVPEGRSRLIGTRRSNCVDSNRETFKVRSNKVENSVIKRTLRTCCYMLLLLCATQLQAFAQAGSTSTHLNDNGAQVGRAIQPVQAAPAAFTGSERPDTASFRMSLPLIDLPGRGLNINLGLHYDSSLYQQTWNGQNSLIDFTGIYPQAPALGFQLGFGTLVKHNDVLDCINLQIGNCPPPNVEFCPFWNGGIQVEKPI